MEMRLIVNFKTYRQGTGQEALELAQGMDDYAQSRVEEKVQLGIAPQLVDLKQIANECSRLKVWSQNLDPINYGSHTGSVLPEAVQNWVTGSLINHSEKRLPFEQIKAAVERCREVSIKSLVCVQKPEEARKVAKLKPNLIAYEPPELIGGDISVAEAKPSLVREAVDSVRAVDGGNNIEVLTGAGIKNGKDVTKALELGTQGILVASGVVKSEKPIKSLKNLIQGV